MWFSQKYDLGAEWRDSSDEKVTAWCKNAEPGAPGQTGIPLKATKYYLLQFSS